LTQLIAGKSIILAAGNLRAFEQKIKTFSTSSSGSAAATFLKQGG
jgi:hypothetical protein